MPPRTVSPFRRLLAAAFVFGALAAPIATAAAEEPALDPAFDARLLSLLRVPEAGSQYYADFQALEAEDARRLAGEDGSRLVLAELYSVRQAAGDATSLLIAQSGHLDNRFGGGGYSDGLFGIMPGQSVRWKQTSGHGTKFVQISEAPGDGRIGNFHYFWSPVFDPSTGELCDAFWGPNSGRPRTGFVLRSSPVVRPPQFGSAYRGSSCGVLPSSFFADPFFPPETASLQAEDLANHSEFPGPVVNGAGTYADVRAKVIPEIDFVRSLSISNMTYTRPWADDGTEWIDYDYHNFNLVRPPRPQTTDEELALARAALLQPQAAEIRQWINWRFSNAPLGFGGTAPTPTPAPGTWSGDVTMTADRTSTDTVHPTVKLTISLGQPLKEPYKLVVYGPRGHALELKSRDGSTQGGGIGDDRVVTVDVSPGNLARTYTAYVAYDPPAVAQPRPVRFVAQSSTITVNASVQPGAPQEPEYVAIGDSFSSGLGTADGYDPSTLLTPTYPNPRDVLTDFRDPGPRTECWRSKDAYPHLIANPTWVAAQGSALFHPVPSAVRHVACQGWTAEDVLRNTEVFEKRQESGREISLRADRTQLGYLTAKTKLVTVGLGGNDIRFGPILDHCNHYRGQDFTGPCKNNEADVARRIVALTKSPGRDAGASRPSVLSTLYLKVKDRDHARNARVLVSGYARFFPNATTSLVPGIGTVTDVGGGGGCGVEWYDKIWINEKVAQLDKGISDSARAAGVAYVDLYNASAGHEICSPPDLVYQHAGRSFPFGGDKLESYHPTRFGHEQMARAFLKRLSDAGNPPVTIRPGQTIRRLMSVPAGSPVIGVNTAWPGSDVVTTLTSPSGRVINRQTTDADVLHEATATWENYTVTEPEPGQWQIDMYGADVASDGEDLTIDLFAAEPDNQRPTATATVTQTGATVTFDATGSRDPEGKPLTYLWGFGDGTGATTATGTHTYSTPGTYAITLAVVDPDEAAGFYSPPDITVQVDATPPTVTITTPANGTQVTQGQTLNASYQCQDTGGSGLATCTGTLANGATIQTTTVGARTFTVTATDSAANTTTRQSQYTVTYPFTGFLSPVNNQPTLNTVNAGRAIPVKFRLGGDQGLSILGTGYPKVQTIGCATGVPTDEVETTTTAGQSTLTYDQPADTYTYVWKTTSTWAGTCRRLIIGLNDTTEHAADFKFR